MRRPPLWIMLALTAAPAMAAFVDCGSTSNAPPPPNTCPDASPPPPTLQGVNVSAKLPPAVLRAKLQPCNSVNDCKGAARVPRCALDGEGYFSCDTTDAGGQPLSPGYNGFCFYSVPIPNSPASFVQTACTCYEGDIRYCDLGKWGACTPATFGPSGSCGIQMCEFGPLGQADASVSAQGGPVPTWGPCLALAPIIVDAGFDGGNDGGE